VTTDLRVSITAQETASRVAERIGIKFAGMGKKIGAAVAPVTRLSRSFSKLGGIIAKIATPLAALATGAGLFLLFQKATEQSNALGREMARLNEIFNRVARVVGDIVAPLISLLVDELEKIVPAGIAAGDVLNTEFVRKVAKTAEDALRWGIEIVSEFASGMIQGATGAMVVALNFISGVLESWLKAFSPPRIAPSIGIWGASAMEEWLKGFTEGDFSILEGIQGPLQSAMSTLVSLGVVAAEKAGKAFVRLSQDIAGAIATGKGFGAVIANLRQVGGRFGDALANIAQGQFNVARATREVEEAERRLADSRKATEQHKGTIQGLRAEFKALRKAGADPAVLKAKREEIKAEQARLRQSRVAGKAAEADVKTAKERETNAKRQLGLQQRLINQLIKMAQVQAQATAAAAAAAAAGVPTGAGIPLPEMPELTGPTAAFEEMKERIRAKLKDLFTPLIERWNNEMKPAIAGLGEAFETFGEIVGKVWTEKIKPLADGMGPDWIVTLGKIAGAILVVWVALQLITTLVTGIAAIGTALSGIWTVISTIGGGIVAVLGGPLTAIIAILAAVALAWHTDFLGFKTRLQDLSASTTVLLNALAAAIGRKFNEIVTGLGGMVQSALTWLNNMVSRFVTIGRNFVTGLINGIVSGASQLSQTLRDMAGNALGAARRALGIGSPSKEAEEKIGVPFMQGIGAAFTRGGPQLQKQLGGMMGNLTGPSMAGAGAGVSGGGMTIGQIGPFTLTGGATREDAMRVADAIEWRLKQRGLRRHFG